MGLKKVFITIAKNGDVESIQPVGYSGPNACYEATAPFDELLAPGTKTDKKTEDFYKAEATTKVRETE
jgi:hypothetical protein